MKYITTPEARYDKPPKPVTKCMDCPEDPSMCGNPCPGYGHGPGGDSPCVTLVTTMCADCGEDPSFC